MLVVFPAPLTPTTITTAGGASTCASGRSVACRISSRCCRINPRSSAASPTSLRSTCCRMRSRISFVVLTPMSALISVYSSSSSRSASISFLPAIASSRRETRPARVFSTPLFSRSSRDGSCSTEPNRVWIILIHCNNRRKIAIARNYNSRGSSRWNRTGRTRRNFKRQERPGWMAIALIASFVLAAVVMFAIGARIVRRSPGPDVSAIAVVPFSDLTPISRQAPPSESSSRANWRTRCQKLRACTSSMRPQAATLSKAVCKQSGNRRASRPGSFAHPTGRACGPKRTIARSGCRPPFKPRSSVPLRTRCICTSRDAPTLTSLRIFVAPFLRVN